MLGVDEALVFFLAGDKESYVFALTREALNGRTISLGAGALDAERLPHFATGLMSMHCGADWMRAGAHVRRRRRNAGCHAWSAPCYREGVRAGGRGRCVASRARTGSHREVLSGELFDWVLRMSFTAH